ncbi:MAG: tetratricopeptide repeat protein [Planctomycetes bacterium]|nr:tetratricopeptide repeat protein [Planctomycetota bacterium]
MTTMLSGFRGGLATALLTCLSFCALAPAVPAAEPSRLEDPNSVRPVPKLESAQEQLRYATSLKIALRGLDGDGRRDGRNAAVRAYRAVREHFPDDVLAASEGAFRAAELLRAGGDVVGALGEFAWVREHGGESPFRVRAMLEQGHLQRRAKHPQEALTAYEAVLTDAGATKRQKDEASLWAGTVHADGERPDDARRAWQRVAEAGEDPLDRVRAYDLLACMAVAKGDLEAAAGILERCRDALADPAAEETRLGERVRASLSGMRAHDELQRAVAERDRAREKTRKDV